MSEDQKLEETSPSTNRSSPDSSRDRSTRKSGNRSKNHADGSKKRRSRRVKDAELPDSSVSKIPDIEEIGKNDVKEQGILEATTTEAVNMEATTTEAVNMEATTTEAVNMEATTTEAVNMEATTTEAVNMEATTTEAVNMEATTTEVVNMEATTKDTNNSDLDTNTEIKGSETSRSFIKQSINEVFKSGLLSSFHRPARGAADSAKEAQSSPCTAETTPEIAITTNKLINIDIDNTIILVGAETFLGSHIVEQLLAQEYSVVALLPDSKCDLYNDLTEWQHNLYTIPVIDDTPIDLDDSIKKCSTLVFASDQGCGDLLLEVLNSMSNLKKIVFTTTIINVIRGHKSYSTALDGTHYSKETSLVGSEKLEFLLEQSVKGLSEDRGISLSSICLPILTGPILISDHVNDKSMKLANNLIKTSIMIPDSQMPTVDVRDAATCCIAAIKNNVERVIVVATDGSSDTIKSWSNNVATATNNAITGPKVGKGWLSSLLPWTTKYTKILLTYAKQTCKFDNSAAKELLNREYITSEQSITDQLKSLQMFSKLGDGNNIFDLSDFGAYSWSKKGSIATSKLEDENCDPTQNQQEVAC